MCIQKGKNRSKETENMTNTALVRPIAWVIGGAAAMTLVGCSTDPIGDAFEKGAEKAAEKAIEGASGGDVDLDSEGGTIKIEGEDGEGMELNVGEDVEVPGSFPSDLPLPDGELMSSTVVDTGFMLQYRVDSDDAADSLVSDLKGSEFDETSAADLGGISSTTLSSDAYNVTVGFLADDEEPMLSYIVTPVESE